MVSGREGDQFNQKHKRKHNRTNLNLNPNLACMVSRSVCNPAPNPNVNPNFSSYLSANLYLTPSPCKPTPLWVCMYQVTHTHSMYPILTAQTPLSTHTPPPQAPYCLCPFGVGIYGLSGTSASLVPPTYIREGIVDSCWMT